MALPGAAPQPSPQVVGAAFVQQYYFVLHKSPDQVHRFYQDSSIFSHPDLNGMITSVTTLQAINDKVLSLEFNNYATEIESADSQASYKGGVLVAVTGSRTGVDKSRRKFTQSFFLAPQEKGGYVVLNDIFRFVDSYHTRETVHVITAATNGDVSVSPSAPEAESSMSTEPIAADSVEDEILHDLDDNDDSDEFSKVLEIEFVEGSSGVTVDREARVVLSNDHTVVSEVAASMLQEDEPKKSYASIVKVYKVSQSPTPIFSPASKPKANLPKASPTKLDSVVNNVKQDFANLKTSTTFEAGVTNGDIEPDNDKNDAEGHSIYIRNLSLSTSPDEVEAEFKKFGPIRPGGVQVRNHKVEPFCFGFVEFMSLDSMQAAIKASPINFGGRQAFVEEKRTTTRVINGVVTNGGAFGGRGRYFPGRGNYWNDNFRGRAPGYGGNQGYGRLEFRGRSDYAGRGRGGMPRPINGYQQRSFPSGNGRMFRPAVANQTAVSA